MNPAESQLTSGAEAERQDLGYIFHPKRYQHAPGYPRLDIVLRPEPTHRHFDPEWVEIEVVGGDGELTSLTVRHPWRSRKQRFRVRPGRFCWGDRKEEECAAFIFGGTLQIATTEADTTCVITSAAPLLYAANHSSIPMLLICEVEILLAEKRATTTQPLEVFQQRLATLDPLMLYAACLDALVEKFEAPDPDHRPAVEFAQFLETERQIVENEVRPRRLPPLDQLLEY
jgi:hypothetical protein